MANSMWIVGNGDNINVWTDNRLGAPLGDTFQVPRDYFLGFASTLNSAIINDMLDTLVDTLQVPQNYYCSSIYFSAPFSLIH
jgi:hypothetical protein